MQTDRLTKEEYGILLALAASERSEDPHTKVGAVIVNRFNEVLATGYNGLKSGERLNPHLSRDEKRKHMIHAEQNALRFVKNVDKPHTVYISLSPCLACAQAIMANNIKRVIYAKEYERDVSFKGIFDIYGVEYYQVSPSMCKNITKSLQNLLSYLY